MFIFLQGMALGAALILPLGPQNTLILTLGIRRQFALLAASFCVLSDMLLIAAGVLGGSAILQQSPLALQIITWCGAAFLLWYGFGIFRQAIRPQVGAEIKGQFMTRGQVLLSLLTVTWINPHVWLDTFVVLGSLGSQMDYHQKLGFIAGAVTASIIWFYLLAILAQALAPWLSRPRPAQIINLIVALVMWFLAGRLINDGIHMLLK